MPAPTSSVCNRLRALCHRAAVPPERVDQLEKAWSGAPPGEAITLLAGPPSTLTLLLARWLGLAAAKALSAAAGAPLVIGPKLHTVQPILGHWPAWVHDELKSRHVVVVPSEGTLNTSLRSDLARLGIVDQVLLVSRLSQPFSAEDRQLADSLAPLAATASVVFLALPGEEGTEAERAELAAYGLAQLQKHGFHGRCVGAGVWYTEGVRPADSIQLLDDWLVARANDVSDGRGAAGLANLAALLTDIEKAPDRPPETALLANEADELGCKFANLVADLGRRLRELAGAGEFPDLVACRQFLIESIQGWLNRPSLVLFDYVETVRPGIKTELLAQATTAADLLYYTSVSDPPQALSRRTQELLRQLGIASAVTVATHFIIYLIGSAFLQSWFASVLANLLATAAAFAAFAAAKRSLSAPGLESIAGSPGVVPAVRGWAVAELRLTNWFNNRIRSLTATLKQECAEIRSQFHLEG